MADDRSRMLAVESRVAELERRVFGEADQEAQYPRCIDSLAAVSDLIKTSTAGRDKFGKLLDRLPEIEQYLDPVYAGRLTLSEDSKTSILLAQEEFIEKMAKDLESLEQLQKILDSEHLKVLPSMRDQFGKLSSRHAQQQEQCGALTSDTRQVLDQYHGLVTSLSKQFIVWDQSVTRAERGTKVK